MTGIDALEPADPPRDIAALMQRADALMGMTLGELAGALGLSLPPDTRAHKGVIGQLLERVLGADAGSRDEPDFTALGVELKTIPVRDDGSAAESTFLCTVPIAELGERDLWESRVGCKLSDVLWIPVQARSDAPLSERMIGRPLRWIPDADERAALTQDYETIAQIVSRGEIATLDARVGEVMQVRPKAASSRVKTRAPSAEGGFEWTTPRGFYLRPSFTTQVLARLTAASAPCVSAEAPAVLKRA